MPYFDGLASMIYGSLPRYRVGLEDLYQPSPEAAYPAAPDWIDSVRDLPDEQRRALRQQAILQAAFAIGRGGQTGEIGTALAGAALQGQDEQARMIAQARTQQEHDYARARDEAEFKQRQDAQHVAEAAKKEQAQALLGLYQRVVDADPALADQAEIAVRQGDMSTLGKLYGQEIPRRQWFREHGMDPDDPVGAERLKQQLDLEEYQKKQSIDLQGLPEKERIEREARLAQEEEFKKRGYGTYYQEPLDALDQARLAQIRAGGGEGAGKFYERSQGVYRIVPGEDGNFRGELVPGVPPEPALSMGSDALGNPLLIDRSSGQAYSVRGTGQGVTPPPYSPPPAPGARHDLASFDAVDRQTSPPAPPRKPNPPPKKNPLRRSSPAVEKSMEAVAKSIGGFQTAAQREQVRRDLEAGVSLQTVLERIRKARAGQ